MHFSGKLINQFFLGFILLVARHFSKLSLYAIKRETKEPNLKKWQKNLILGLILTCFSPNLVYLVPNFFLVCTSARYYKFRKLSLYAISRKTNEQNLRKWQKKLIWGLILICFSPNLVNLVPNFFFVFTSARYYTLSQAIIVCNFKEN